MSNVLLKKYKIKLFCIFNTDISIKQSAYQADSSFTVGLENTHVNKDTSQNKQKKGDSALERMNGKYVGLAN